MSCDKCNSERVARVDAKCSDMCVIDYKDKEQNGYVPLGMSIGGGDCVGFSYCLECGKIQGDFPIEDPEWLDTPPTQYEKILGILPRWP